MTPPGLGPGSVAVVLGTRPEAIKLAVLVELLGDAALVVATGQHHDVELWQSVLDGLGFPAPDVALAVGGTSRAAQIGRATEALGACFDERRPSVVVVQGDTNAGAAGAIAANASGIALAHVEAGLRSFDRRMPEEHNRVLVDHLADACLAPTEVARANLLAEAVPDERITVTGNTVVEAVLRLTPAGADRTAVLEAHGVEPDGFVLATLHRPENADDPATLAAILGELAGLPVPVLLPLHPRTRARASAFGLDALLAAGGLRVVEPLPPRPFLALAAGAAVLVSDSGGVQEEVSVLKRPVVVVRRSTERPEVLGTFATLVDPGPAVGAAVAAVLDDLAAVHLRLATTPSPYGDGSASARSLAVIADLVAACEHGHG